MDIDPVQNNKVEVKNPSAIGFLVFIRLSIFFPKFSSVPSISISSPIKEPTAIDPTTISILFDFNPLSIPIIIVVRPKAFIIVSLYFSLTFLPIKKPIKLPKIIAMKLTNVPNINPPN